MIKTSIIAAALALAAFTFMPTLQDEGARPDAQALAAAVQEIETLDAMRSSLARTFSGVPDQATFAQVCKPVGAKARGIAEARGWRVQQLALKYRNPAHLLDDEARRTYEAMAANPDLMGAWVRSEQDGKTGTRYFRRIVVESACLACHGEKDRRPQFIKDGYPDDRAFGFQEGELRGLYSVFVAD